MSNGTPSKKQKTEEAKIVLVTGGSGLVGKGIEAHLQKFPHSNEQYIYLTSKEGDLRNYEQTLKIFQKYKPTHVIHLAAIVGGLFKNMREKLRMYRENEMINDNVLRCAAETGVKKCVSCLSTCIFPDKTTYPIDETMVHNGAPHFSNEGYAYAKRMIDVLNRLYNESQKTCLFTSVIPTNVYGPHDNYNLEDSHVIPGLIHKCYLAEKSGKDFVVWGSGKPLRQFIYNEDLGALIVWTLDHYDDEHPIILSVGEEDEVTIGQMAEMIAKAMKFSGKVIYDTSKADGQFKKTASNKKLKGLYPTFQFTPVDKAIDMSVAWFLNNYNTLRK